MILIISCILGVVLAVALGMTFVTLYSCPKVIPKGIDVGDVISATQFGSDFINLSKLTVVKRTGVPYENVCGILVESCTVKG